MALDPSAIFDIAEDLLASVATRLSAAPISITLPSRQYVHQGEVALDCEQLVVSGGGLEHAMPSDVPVIAVCAPPHSVTLDVWLTRCVPVQKDGGDPPTSTELTDSAEQLLTDMWSLAYVLYAYRDDWAPTCMAKLFGPVVPYGPEGAYGGSHATVFLQLI